MNWNEIFNDFLPMIVRMVLIVFSTLGVVYMCGRLLFPKMKRKGKNRIAFFTLLVTGFTVTLVFDYTGLIDRYDRLVFIRYIIDSALYSSVAAVFYVVVGWRFYSRADRFLDKKFAKDDNSNSR